MRERKSEKELVIRIIITGADAEEPDEPEYWIEEEEGVDLIPSNLELSSMEIQLVNAMSREVTLKNYIKEAKLKERYTRLNTLGTRTEALPLTEHGELLLMMKERQIFLKNILITALKTHSFIWTAKAAYAFLSAQ